MIRIPCWPVLMVHLRAEFAVELMRARGRDVVRYAARTL